MPILPLKRGAHLGFNAIRVLKKNVLTFCLHKVLIKRRVPLGNHLCGSICGPICVSICGPI